MDFSKIKDRWFASKEGTLDVRDLRQVRRDADGVWYECPCGGTDHVGLRRPMDYGGSVSISPVLTCFVTRRQWLVTTDSAGIIRDEEQSFLDLLVSAEKTVAKAVRRRGASGETVAFLKDTHGVPEDVSRSLMGAV